jgi:hypothetical protein
VTLASTSWGTQALRLDDAELVARSRAIVHGEVIARTYHATADGRIYTRYTFRAHEMLKGRAAAGGTVTFREWGGEAGGLRYWVPGAGDFDVGDEVIAFLAETDPLTDVGFTTGMAQGKFRIVRSEDTGVARAVRTFGALELVSADGVETGRVADPDARDLGPLLDKIRAFVRRQR